MRTRGHKSDDYALLPDFLREMREAAGLTQRELGAILNKPQSWVNANEHCLRRVDLPEFVRWCQACDAAVGKAAEKYAASLSKFAKRA